MLQNYRFSLYLWCFDDNLNGLLRIESSGRSVRLFIIVIIIFFPVNITPQTGEKKKRNSVLTAMFPKFYIKINVLFAMKTHRMSILYFFNFLCVYIKFTAEKFQMAHFNFARYLYYLICRINISMSTPARHIILYTIFIM